MKVIVELTAHNIYNMLWSEAQSTLENLTPKDVQIVLDKIEAIQLEEGYTLAEINGFFVFERDLIAEWLGYNYYDELVEARHVQSHRNG